MATDNLISLSTFSTRDPLGEDDAKPGGVFSGVLRDRTEGGWRVTSERGAFVAAVAPSCLLAPEPEDLVLLARVPEGVFVLAVLARQGEGGRIALEGELKITAPRVEVEASEELTLRSRGVAQLVANAMTMATAEASWVGKQLRVLGEQFVVDATRIQQRSTYTDVEAESRRERLGRSYREVRDAEHVKAGAMTLSLRDTLTLRANAAVMTAKRLLRLAGDQIHLG